MNWYRNRSEEVNKEMNSNDSGNKQLTSPKIQKEIINSYVTEVRNLLSIRLKISSFLFQLMRLEIIK